MKLKRLPIIKKKKQYNRDFEMNIFFESLKDGRCFYSSKTSTVYSHKILLI